ncbi:MAG: 5'-methylthioadenosine/adenosylhomocysteine nucleosidase [Eubacteriales bacterium]|nr:5'-methylthioadenosine/adenosylhomocysteine nucleosidase [Eubacteriales bacterium]
MLAFIGAMEDEVAGIRAALSDTEAKEYAGRTVIEGTYQGARAVIVQAGIGKVNAALCTQMIIDRYAPSAIINTGIAGSLNSSIAIGDLVLSTDAVEHDVDATTFGDPAGQVPNMDVFSFTADEGLRALAKEAAAAVLPDVGCHEGRVLTGDQFISSQEKKDWLVNTFAGDCCEMEGGAIAQVCHVNKVPFLIIRAISDSADNSAHMDYPAFEQMAIANSVKLALELIRRSAE